MNCPRLKIIFILSSSKILKIDSDRRNELCMQITKELKGGILSKYLHRSGHAPMTISFEILTLGYLSKADLSVSDEVSSLKPS